jgi:hypothetical protein
MLMPVKQNSFTHLRVLLVLTDHGILGLVVKLASLMGGFVLVSIGGPLGRTLSACYRHSTVLYYSLAMYDVLTDEFLV